MKRYDRSLVGVLALALALEPGRALAFDSGSTGADGAFNPTVNTEVQIPPSGLFNYTTVNIPAGVTVTYKRNTANTPLVILASGAVTIAGTLDVRGKTAPGVGAAGDGNQGNDSQPGAGGPGGFEGGKGGAAGAGSTFGGAGLGPGAGNPGFFMLPGNNCIDGGGWASGGTGGGFSAQAQASGRTSFACNGGGQFTYTHTQAQGGVGYGSSVLLPLIGGSAGGGGGGGVTFDGGGGGGGGGAILIASSGTVTVTGALLADGGAGAAASGAGIGGAGGGGAGGGIRIIATTIAGNGFISAQGGAAGQRSGQSYTVYDATAGAPGRIRLEGDAITRVAATTPLATSDVPGTIFVAGLPTLKITSVAGMNAPPDPTGSADITLPASTPNPVLVTFATTGVPLGNTVKLTVTPQNGLTTSTVSPAITGSVENGVASVPTNLPVGPSVLQAQTTFTIVAAFGQLLRYYADNEPVERIELTATFGGPSIARLITASGKTYEVPQALLAVLGM